MVVVVWKIVIPLELRIARLLLFWLEFKEELTKKTQLHKRISSDHDAIPSSCSYLVQATWTLLICVLHLTLIYIYIYIYIYISLSL